MDLTGTGSPLTRTIAPPLQPAFVTPLNGAKTTLNPIKTATHYPIAPNQPLSSMRHRSLTLSTYRSRTSLIQAQHDPGQRPEPEDPLKSGDKRTGDLRTHPLSQLAYNIKSRFSAPQPIDLIQPSRMTDEPIDLIDSMDSNGSSTFNDEADKVDGADESDEADEAIETNHNQDNQHLVATQPGSKKRGSEEPEKDNADQPSDRQLAVRGRKSILEESQKSLNRHLKPFLAISRLVQSLQKNAIPLLVLFERLGHLPIHTAVHLDTKTVISHLVQLGQDPDAMNEYLLTPLMVACHLHRMPVISQFIETLKANPNLVDRNGFNCLYYACGLAHLEKPGYRAYQLKEAFENLTIIDYLLKQGADPNQQDKHGQTVLHHLVKSTHNLANILRQTAHHPLLKESHQQLMQFITQKVTEQISLLLAHGANVSIRDNDGHTALHKAAIGGNPEIIKTLLKSGGDIFLLDRDNNCHTPHDLAIQFKQSAAAETLSEAVQKKLPISDIKDLQFPKANSCFTLPPASQESIKESENLWSMQRSHRRHFVTEWMRVIVAFQLGQHWEAISEKISLLNNLPDWWDKL